MKRTLAGLLLVLTLTSCGGGDEPLTAKERAAVDEALEVEVRYFVEGTVDAVDITIETPTGTSQQSNADVPLMANDGTEGLHFTTQMGSFVYIAAQNTDDSGEVTCRIEVDGEVVSENRSSGAYSIATCKGSA